MDILTYLQMTRVSVGIERKSGKKAVNEIRGRKEDSRRSTAFCHR